MNEPFDRFSVYRRLQKSLILRERTGHDEEASEAIREVMDDAWDGLNADQRRDLSSQAMTLCAQLDGEAP